MLNQDSLSLVPLDAILDNIDRKTKEQLEKEKNISKKKMKKKIKETELEWFKDNFKVPHNEIINDYIIKGKMIDDYNHDISKSYFLKDENGLLAFFCIRLEIVKIKEIDKNVKKNMVPTGQSPNKTEEIVTFLIEQVAKNCNIENNPIHLDDILSFAISKIKEVAKSIGGILATLNSIIPQDKPECVVSKYEKFGFEKFGDLVLPHGESESDIKYQPMYLRIKDR